MSVSFKSLALAASLLAAPAIALADPGFEPGAPASTLVTSGGGSYVIGADYSFAYTAATDGFDASGTVTPVVGNFLGAFTANDDPTNPYVIEFTFAAPTNAGDSLYLGLVASDVDPAFAVDFYKLEIFDINGPAFSQTFDAKTLSDASSLFPFSGWKQFIIGTGVTSIKITLSNDVDASYSPTLLVDYYNSPAVVPEAGATTMALAGLGVVGLLAARRRRRAA